MNNFSQKFFEITEAADSILLTTHKDPDGDAIASILAVFYLLSQKYPSASGGKNIRMLISSPINQRFASFANFEKIESVADVADEIDKFDLAIFLDANYAERFTINFEKYKAYQGKRICIDHHPDKGETFDLKLVNPDASATAQLVYNLLLKEDAKLDKELCEILMMGLMSDTGNFKYITPKNSEVFLIAERLVKDGGLNVDYLASRFTGYSTRVFAILQEFLKNAKIEKVGKWPDFIYSYITPQFAEAGNYSILETEEAAAIFTDYLRALDEASWGFVARNYEHKVKVSLRSRANSVNVCALAEGLGRGSGHIHSAGAKFTKEDNSRFEVLEAIEEIKGYLAQNKPVFPVIQPG